MNRFFVALALSGSVHAADISGRVEIENGGFIPPGTFSRAVLTITNNGPDDTETVGVGTIYIANVGFRTIGLIPTDETPPCTVNYMDIGLPPPGLITISVNIFANRTLAAGESVSCVVAINTYPESPAIFQQRFNFGISDTDPNQSNNLVNVTITTRPVVSLPLSGGAMLAIALGAAVVGGWRLRK
jgi:hypothetical protein